MADPQIEQRVRELISDQLGIAEEEITLDSSFVHDLGADSLDLMELFMSFEEEFELEISEEDGERLETVGRLVEFIEHQTH